MKKLIVLCGIVTAYVCFSFMPGPDLVVTSSAFQHNKDIPRKYSCEGQNISPDLHIGNIPAEAKTLAIIMHDPDAPVDGGFTHWVVWNVSTDGQIPENFLGGKQGLNGAQKAGYTGMCPPQLVNIVTTSPYMHWMPNWTWWTEQTNPRWKEL